MTVQYATFSLHWGDAFHTPKYSKCRRCHLSRGYSAAQLLGNKLRPFRHVACPCHGALESPLLPIFSLSHRLPSRVKATQRPHLLQTKCAPLAKQPGAVTTSTPRLTLRLIPGLLPRDTQPTLVQCLHVIQAILARYPLFTRAGVWGIGYVVSLLLASPVTKRFARDDLARSRAPHGANAELSLFLQPQPFLSHSPRNFPARCFVG